MRPVFQPFPTWRLGSRHREYMQVAWMPKWRNQALEAAKDSQYQWRVTKKDSLLKEPVWSFTGFGCSTYLFCIHTRPYHYITLPDLTLNYLTLRYIPSHYIPLHYVTLHYSTLQYCVHYRTLQYTALHYIRTYWGAPPYSNYHHDYYIFWQTLPASTCSSMTFPSPII